MGDWSYNTIVIFLAGLSSLINTGKNMCPLTVTHYCAVENVAFFISIRREPIDDRSTLYCDHTTKLLSNNNDGSQLSTADRGNLAAVRTTRSTDWRLRCHHVQSVFGADTLRSGDMPTSVRYSVWHSFHRLLCVRYRFLCYFARENKTSSAQSQRSNGQHSAKLDIMNFLFL